MLAAALGRSSDDRPGFNYVKAGVTLVDLGPRAGAGRTGPVLGDALGRRHSASRANPRLMGAVDSLNRRFGRGAVGVALSVRCNESNGWAMCRSSSGGHRDTRRDTTKFQPQGPSSRQGQQACEMDGLGVTFAKMRLRHAVCPQVVLAAPAIRVGDADSDCGVQ